MTFFWLSAILAPEEFKETVWAGFGCFRTGSSNEPSSSISNEELLSKLSDSLVLVTICLKHWYQCMHVWSADGKL